MPTSTPTWSGMRVARRAARPRRRRVPAPDPRHQRRGGRMGRSRALGPVPHQLTATARSTWVAATAVVAGGPATPGTVAGAGTPPVGTTATVAGAVIVAVAAAKPIPLI